MNVNWDDDIPNRWENKRHVPVITNQINIYVVITIPLISGIQTAHQLMASLVDGCRS